jgi:hypothetical protein
MTRIDADSVNVLSNVLREVRVLLSESQDSAWAVVTVSELLASIDKQIASLNASQVCRAADHKQILAPTSALQDIAGDNGWGSQFIRLSAEFDRLMASA